jgi:glycosyltransferase involved in cell wall biosynthesis
MRKNGTRDETSIVVCPLSPGLLSAPTLISGATTHIAGFANALAARSDTRVRVMYSLAADLSQFSDNVEIVPLHLPRQLERPLPLIAWLVLWNLITLRWGCREVMSGFRQGRSIDVMYVRFSASVVLPLLLLKMFMPSTLFLFEINTPASVSAASHGPIVRWFSRLLDRLTLAVCDGAFVVSEDLRAIIIEQRGHWVKEKLFLNVNGVDPDRFRALSNRQAVSSYRRSLGIETSSCVIGYVGKALPHHRLDIVARLVRDVHDVPLKLVIAGSVDAVSGEELERIGCGNVVLLGQIPHERVPLFLNACDVLVLPHGPSYEGRLHQSPIKLFEYMAVGKPVVASRIGQIERVITHGKNGLLFDENDHAQLERHLKRLATDAELRERLGEAARRTVIAQYTWDHNAGRVMAAVRKLRQ